MIFHPHKAIFFHIGKTAGMSIERMLDPDKRNSNETDYDRFYGAEPALKIFLQHATPAFMRSRIPAEVFDSYFKFTVVRNPFARLLSVYFYLRVMHEKEFGSFEGLIQALPEMPASKVPLEGSHYLPQVAYTHIEGKPVCDDIIYFENLTEGVDRIRKVLGIDAELGHINRLFDQGYKESSVASHYTNTMIDIMHDIYAEDFVEFGYSKDPHAADYR